MNVSYALDVCVCVGRKIRRLGQQKDIEPFYIVGQTSDCYSNRVFFVFTLDFHFKFKTQARLETRTASSSISISVHCAEEEHCPSLLTVVVQEL